MQSKVETSQSSGYRRACTSWRNKCRLIAISPTAYRRYNTISHPPYRGYSYYGVLTFLIERRIYFNSLS